MSIGLRRVIIFCNKHRLSPSIKAGGYGTAGVAIGGNSVVSPLLCLMLATYLFRNGGSLGDIIVDLSRLRGIAIEVPDDSTPRGYVGLRDQVAPTDKGKGKARPRPSQTVTTLKPQGIDSTSTTSLAPLKRRRGDEESDDDEEKAAYEARLRTYDPAAPGVSSFLSGPPFAPEPGVDRRMPPQDYRAPRLGTADSTGSEAASIHFAGDRQDTDGVDSITMAMSESRTDSQLSGIGGGPATIRGPFDHMNLAGESGTADAPRTTPWFPSRVRPFDYLGTTDSSFDTGPVQQPTYQQSMNSSGGLASFPTFSSNSPFSGVTFPPMNIPHDSPHSSFQSTGEGSLSPASQSSAFNPHLPADMDNPPLDHRTLLEPRYSHVYVTFGAGVLQKEIDMHTADNPVEAKESHDGAVGLIPYHVPTCVQSDQ